MKYSLLALSLVFATTAHAQPANPQDIGFVASSGNNSVGACSEFSCTPHNISVSPDQANRLYLSVFGGHDMPYLIAASARPGACVSLPGVANRFALEPATTVLVAVGRLDNLDPNVCGRAKATISFRIPADIQDGVTATFQAISFSPLVEATPAFSRPIVVTAGSAVTN